MICLSRARSGLPTSRGGVEVETVLGPEDIQHSLQLLFSTEPGKRAGGTSLVAT